MRKVFLIFILVMLAILCGFLILMGRGPDLSQFEGLKEPRMRTMENMKVLVVETIGSPEIVSGKAFGLLFKTYFSIKGAPKGRKMPAPRARWPLSTDIPKEEWKGLYAMPVPPETAVLPETKTEPCLDMRLDVWEYGEVAEILHIGPYDREEPTVARLTSFIRDKGYTIIGDQEEEYLKGPGMFFKGNPDKYSTIIRYRVQKAQ